MPAGDTTMEALSPEALVRLCQETLPEDTRAFEALVARVKGRVYATAYHLLGNRQDAEDQTQEVFIKVYRGILDLNDPATVESWIYRITVNSCFDALDKRQRSPATTSTTPQTPAPDDPAEVADTGTANPEETALQRELRACLEAALQAMDRNERTVLVLRDIEGRQYQEIAETLAVGLSAVKMRIHRARLAFQQLFEQLCPELWQASGMSGAGEAATG